MALLYHSELMMNVPSNFVISLLHNILFSATMTNAGYRFQYELTKNTSYLGIVGKLWSVICE